MKHCCQGYVAIKFITTFWQSPYRTSKNLRFTAMKKHT